jgi:hypothetical protein
MKTEGNKVDGAFKSFIDRLNKKFNELSLKVKKLITIAFILLASGICLVTAIVPGNPSINYMNEYSITPEIPMKELTENQKLIPLGKMKGEVDGNFDSFYVAIDNQGKLFINRNLNYGKDAYTKDDRWENISIRKLKEYERHLHFIPMKSKGLKY